jgi:PIN domain nuclease of toxin-antitoxin system
MLLLDSCTLFWITSLPEKLSAEAQKQVTDHRTALFVASISALEIAIKYRRRKLSLPLPPEKWFGDAVTAYALTEVPLDSAIAIASTRLPELHNDPFDRIIIATAQSRALRIVTPDAMIGAYPGVDVIW